MCACDAKQSEGKLESLSLYEAHSIMYVMALTTFSKPRSDNIRFVSKLIVYFEWIRLAVFCQQKWECEKETNKLNKWFGDEVFGMSSYWM